MDKPRPCFGLSSINSHPLGSRVDDCPECDEAPAQPAKKAKRVTEDDQFVAMMQRMIRALELRAINDPAVLAQVVMLAQHLAEVVNVVVATSADKYAVDPHSSPSMAECAAILGITKQSASDRRKVGNRIIAERFAAAGIGNFPAARRERKAREAAAAHAAATMPRWTQTVRHLRAV